MTNKERDEVAFHTWHHLPTQDLETWHAACAYKEKENDILNAKLKFATEGLGAFLFTPHTNDPMGEIFDIWKMIRSKSEKLEDYKGTLTELWAMLEKLEGAWDHCPLCHKGMGCDKDCKLAELLKRKPV